ncbi:MAG: D-alanyl-D-alanine carboxypeptidase/D-alanyl-D-alanine-endopeptidase [Bacteroidia bacterium]|nr:D-alanyl-D-alanine carboxypeptidase/D-alanyl-D-alanine-endopeptidase [Bacteroidia bacterium]
MAVISLAFPGSGELSVLKKELNALKNDPEMKGGTISFALMDIRQDSFILDMSRDQLMTPASALKLFVCAAALDKMGPAHRFNTAVAYSGQFDALTGVLTGDLIIRGSGDPTTGSRYLNPGGIKALQNWIDQVTRFGIKEITGKVIADGSVLEDSLAPASWPESDVGNYYGAGAAGLNYLDNSYTLFFQTFKTGTAAKFLYADPLVPGMSFYSEVTAQGTSDKAFIYGREYTYKRMIRGTLPPEKKLFGVRGSLPDPAEYLAYVCDSLFRKAGIKTGGYGTHRTCKVNEPGKEIFVHRSAPLDTIVMITLRASHNMFAEALLKSLSVTKERQGSRVGGLRVIKEWMKKNGIDTVGFFPLDGSGLSPGNRVSASHFCRMLSSFAKSPAYDAIFKGLKLSNGSVYSKSGYISGVRSYAGYVRSGSGKTYSFALMINGYDFAPGVARKKLEAILAVLGSL